MRKEESAIHTKDNHVLHLMCFGSNTATRIYRLLIDLSRPGQTHTRIGMIANTKTPLINNNLMYIFD